MSERHDAIVCGAGAAGLSAAAVLKRRGLDPVVLERGEGVGNSWRHRYEGLRLNTLGWMSTLPGYRATKRKYGDYPPRETWLSYLEDFARHHKIEPRLGVEVTRIDRADGGWAVETGAGSLHAPVVVVATGFDHDPSLPDWPGREGFTGELLHAASFRNATPFRDRDVLVVGPNITGVEVATFLVRGGASRVRVAMRAAPAIFPRRWLGIHLAIVAVTLNRLPTAIGDLNTAIVQRLIWGDLSKYGLPKPAIGAVTNMRQNLRGSAVDDGFVAELKAGRVEIVPAVEAFDGADVVLAGGERIQPEVVIAATGYERGLEPLVGHLGVLNDVGLPTGPGGPPTARGGRALPGAPGLFFTGYYGQLSGQMREMRYEARAIGRAVRRMRVRSAAGPAPATATLVR